MNPITGTTYNNAADMEMTSCRCILIKGEKSMFAIPCYTLYHTENNEESHYDIKYTILCIHLSLSLIINHTRLEPFTTIPSKRTNTTYKYYKPDCKGCRIHLASSKGNLPPYTRRRPYPISSRHSSISHTK